MCILLQSHVVSSSSLHSLIISFNFVQSRKRLYEISLSLSPAINEFSYGANIVRNLDRFCSNIKQISAKNFFLEISFHTIYAVGFKLEQILRIILCRNCANIVPILYKLSGNLMEITGKYQKIFYHINFHGLFKISPIVQILCKYCTNIV